MNKVFSNIICGKNYTISIGENNKVYHFGQNYFYLDKKEDTSIPTEINILCDIKIIDCGSYHFICCDYSGFAFSCGKNTYGQLGVGTMGEIQTINKINVPPIESVSCGDNFSFCLSKDLKLYSFGRGQEGQLGIGNNKNKSEPQILSSLLEVELIICGSFHVLCKTFNNEIYSWGYGYDGQLGHGNLNSQNTPKLCENWPDDIISIKCGSYHTLILTTDGYVYSFGYDQYSQLGLGKYKNNQNTPTLIKDLPVIQRISCGSNHSVCIDIDHNVWYFGNNTTGQLGLDNETKLVNVPTKNNNFHNIIDISDRGDHTFVKTSDNIIYGFGKNNYNELGIKEGNTIKKPIQVLKNNENIWSTNLGKSRAKSARK